MRSDPVFLFDLDGTLVDSVYQHVLAWKEALDAEGIDLSVWRIHRRIGMSGGLFTNQLLRETELGLQRGAGRAGCGAAMPRPTSGYRDAIRPLPGARELLAWLTDAGIPWAIATSGRMETAAVNLAALGVDPASTPVVTRDQVRYAKPDPDLFLAAAERLGRADRDGGGGGRRDLGHAGGGALPGARRRAPQRRLRLGGAAPGRGDPGVRRPGGPARPHRRGRRAAVGAFSDRARLLCSLAGPSPGASWRRARGVRPGLTGVIGAASVGAESRPPSGWAGAVERASRQPMRPPPCLVMATTEGRAGIASSKSGQRVEGSS